MSKTVEISSTEQFRALQKSSKIVVADFYADWCGPCKQLEPIYEQLSQALSRPNVVTFARIDTDAQKDLALQYKVSHLPTFIVFRGERVLQEVKGADPDRLRMVVRKLAAEVESIDEAGGSGSGVAWRGAELPRGYIDITNQVELQRCELLNVDTDAPGAGSVRVLFDEDQPSALSKDGSPKEGPKDWIESDTDEQLLLFMPFQSMLKLHTLQITSLPPKDDDEAPMRPHTIKLFSNKPHNLGFDEAENTMATQVVDLNEEDWNAEGTASISLRFVKFQNITSLVLFVVDGDKGNDSEKVRIDRIKLIGESGEKREMGKLEKIGDEPGE